MLPMTSTGASLSRVLLVAEKDGPAPDGLSDSRALERKVRRYRLARLHLDGRPTASERHAHLRRSYD